MENTRLLGIIREQVARLVSYPFYGKRFQQTGLKPEDIRSWRDFEQIPFMGPKDLQKDLEDHPPYGSLFHPDAVRVHLTPGSQGLLPVYQTQRDIDELNQEQTRLYRAAGVNPCDVAAITFGYHLFIAGLTIQGGFEAMGCKTLPLGPGDSQRTAEIIRRFQVTILASNPSFTLKLAQEGKLPLRMLFAGGEPFSSVEGYKQKLRSALGPIGLIDSYGLGFSTPLARECREERGLHVADHLIYLEIIDPEQGTVLPEGHRGEVVITHLRREGSPFLRFRTGDLSVLESIDCPCGRRATLTRGVLGRTDDMHKVKGVKLYPSQIDHILRTLPEYSPGRYQVALHTKSAGGDHFLLRVEGKPPEAAALVRLTEQMKNTLLIRPDQVEFVEKLPDGPRVIDRRYE